MDENDYLCSVNMRRMVKYVTGLLLLVMILACRAARDIDLPRPLKGVSEQILYRKGYVVSYNKDTRLPNWVAWHLTAEHTEGMVKRPSNNAWHDDMEVSKPRATSRDYYKTGWTRGHLCPVADNKWDSEAMYETFLMTNCCPQHQSLNTGDWNEIEMSCRKWAKKHGDLYIVCGPLFIGKQHEEIGANRVVVPEAFFKVVMCLNGKPKGIGYICRNRGDNHKKRFYQHSIREVERITGMTFFPHLSSKVAKAVKDSADENEW